MMRFLYMQSPKKLIALEYFYYLLRLSTPPFISYFVNVVQRNASYLPSWCRNQKGMATAKLEARRGGCIILCNVFPLWTAPLPFANGFFFSVCLNLFFIQNGNVIFSIFFFKPKTFFLNNFLERKIITNSFPFHLNVFCRFVYVYHNILPLLIFFREKKSQS